MGWARIAITNEDWAPLQGVDVECFSLDTHTPLAVVTSDIGGIAFFDNLPEDLRYFFKPRARRTSTRVQSTLDPAEGRTYTGQVRLQILASHPGTNCFDYFVEPSGIYGTHKTIQAAINAATVLTGIKRILVMAGTYAENLVIPGISGSYHLSALFIEGCTPAHAAISPETTPSVPVNAAPVLVNGGAAAALTYGSSFSGPYTVLIGMGFKASFAGRVVDLSRGFIQFIRCTVQQGNAAGTGIDTGGVSTQLCDKIVLEHCVIDGGAFAIRAVTIPRILNCQIKGPVSLAIGSAAEEGIYVANNSFDANNADYAVDLQHNASLDPMRFENNIVRQRNAGGGGISLGGLTTPLEGHVIVGNEFHGPGAGIAIRIGGGATSIVTQAVVVGNALWQWATGVSIDSHSTAVVLGNSYSNVATQIDGTVTVNPSEFGHVLLGPLHTDTLAGLVLDGDTIIGNVTPKWSRLAISIPAANVRNVFGIDNGELRPSWKTALDGTAPADIAAAGLAGTSLVFSHRDHVHKHPVFASGALHTDYELVGVAAGLIATHAGLPDVHHAGFIGLTITGPANIDPGVGDRITIEDTASVTWASSGAGKIAATAVGGGGAPHALLSATHTDTTAHAAVVGDLITGQAGPVWARLAIGVNTTILGSDGTDAAWHAQSFIDHGSIGGLGDDDHTGYLLLAGRAGGQIGYGGTGASDDLVLYGTSHATKGHVVLPERGLTVGTTGVADNTRFGAVFAPSITSVGIAVGDVAAVGITPTIVGATWGVNNPTFWGLISFLSTGAVEEAGKGLNALVGAQIESFVGNLKAGNTLPTVEAAEFVSGFYGAAATGAITDARTVVARAPGRYGGAAAGDITNAVSLVLEEPTLGSSVNDYLEFRPNGLGAALGYFRSYGTTLDLLMNGRIAAGSGGLTANLGAVGGMYLISPAPQFRLEPNASAGQMVMEFMAWNQIGVFRLFKKAATDTRIKWDFGLVDGAQTASQDPDFLISRYTGAVGVEAQDHVVRAVNSDGSVNFYHALRAAGYGRVGSTSAPLNTTAGDLTSIRSFIGDDATPLNNAVFQVRRAGVDPAGGTYYISYFRTSAAPAGAGGIFTPLFSSIVVQPTASDAGVGLYGAYIQLNQSSGGAFNVGNMIGLLGEVIKNSAGVGSVANLVGARWSYRAQAGVVGTAVAFDIVRGNVADAGTITTGIGLRIGASAGVTPGADIAIQSLGGMHRLVGATKIGADLSPLAGTILDVAGGSVFATAAATVAIMRLRGNGITTEGFISPATAQSAVYITHKLTDPLGGGTLDAMNIYMSYIGDLSTPVVTLEGFEVVTVASGVTVAPTQAIHGAEFAAQLRGGGMDAITFPQLVGMYGDVNIPDTHCGTITWARSAAVTQPTGLATGNAMTNAAGLYVHGTGSIVAGNVTPTNAYGIYLQVPALGTNKWALYATGLIETTGALTIGGTFSMGANYGDIAEIAAPANPGAGTRRLFVDNATHELSVRTSAGTTVSLESGGGGGAHDLLSATHSDTDAHAAVRGGLVVGNATPHWAYLAVGVAGSGLWTDGTNTSWTVSPQYAGYLRVGSAAAPTNVTAGDLNAVRLFVGADAAIPAGYIADIQGAAYISGNLKNLGHASIGSLSTPSTTRAVNVIETYASAAFAGFTGLFVSATDTGTGIGTVVAGYFLAESTGATTKGATGLFGSGTTSSTSNGSNVEGLNFAAVCNAATKTVVSMVGIKVTLQTITQSGLITAAYGLHIVGSYGANLAVTTMKGIYIPNSLSPTGVVNAYGLHIGDMVGSTLVRLLEIGPDTPYLRLVGGAVPGANATNLYLNENGTLRQVLWKNPDAGGHLAAADKVLVLV